jgi:hypothetical protein
MPETYKFKRKPYRHQVSALRYLLEQGWGGALLMSPRTGKTKVAVDWTSILYQKDKLNRVLVICPVGVIGVWIDEITKNCPFPCRIVVWDKEGRKEVSLPPHSLNKLVFVVVNYDAFGTPGALLNSKTGRRSRSRGGRYDVWKKVSRWQPQAVILDESHRIKSAKAKKTTMIHRLYPITPYRLILTGTAVTKKKRIFDLWSQWQFLNRASPLVKGKTMSMFKDEYGVWTKRNGYPQFLRERNQKRLHQLLHDEAFAVERDECYDLPKRTNQIIPVQLTGHNYDVYREMATTMVAQIKSGELTTAQIKLVLNLRLAQLTGGLARTMPSEQHPKGRLVRVGSDKLNVWEERLLDLMEADEKVVVAARFRADIAAIVKICAKHKVRSFELHGGIRRADRDGNISTFSRMSDGAVFIMQPSAGSLGIDLSAASIFQWYSLPGGNWVDFTQAEDRVALSPRPTFFEYFECVDLIDTDLRLALEEDGDVVKTVMRSPDRLLRAFK